MSTYSAKILFTFDIDEDNKKSIFCEESIISFNADSAEDAYEYARKYDEARQQEQKDYLNARSVGWSMVLDQSGWVYQGNI